MKRVLLLLFLCSSIAASDEVYFKSHAVIRNVVVTDTILIANEPVITIKGKGFVARYKLSDVETIRKSSFDLTEFPSISNQDQLPEKQVLPRIQIDEAAAPRDSVVSSKSMATESRPNLKLLPISVLAFGLTWDFFARASDAGNAIDEINKLPPALRPDTSDLEALRSRRTILGIACAVVGVINTVIAVLPVQIRANSSSVTVSYNF